MNKNEPLFSTRELKFKDFLSFPDLEFPQDRVTFITGSSGCGKSTLLKLMNNSVSASAGQVFYRGKAVEKLDPIMLRRQVCLVSQDSFLFDGSIQDNFNIIFRLRERELPNNESLRRIMETCCLDLPLTTPAAQLSGGERHRLYMALFISLSPDVLLLDEPTAALDEANSAMVMGNIARMCKNLGMGLIVVSHDLTMAKAFADNIITLKGRDD